MTSALNVTALLQRAAQGDRDAFDQAFALIHRELEGIARARLRHEADGHTLDTGALVNESYLRLGQGSVPSVQSRSHFFAIASKAMRRILVEHARRAFAGKRGGEAKRVPLESIDVPIDAYDDERVVDLDEALQRLASFDARQAQVVECRFFGGLTEEETADALSIGLRTVKRDWAKARSWLFRELHGDGAA